MSNYLLIGQILVAVALVVVLLFQVKGGGLGGIFGQADTVYRRRRGVEKRLLQFTVALMILLVILSVLVVRFTT